MTYRETLAIQIEEIEAKLAKGPWSETALEAAIRHVQRNTDVMEDALTYQAEGEPEGLPGRYDGLWLAKLRNNLPTILSALRASTEGGEETSGDLKDVKQRLLDGIADYEKDQADGWERGERPDLWDHVVEVPVADAKKILAVLSSSPSIRDQVIEECARAVRFNRERSAQAFKNGASTDTDDFLMNLDHLEAAIRSLSTKPTEAEGWVRVPEEPTEEMRQAGFDANGNGSWADTERCYRAMIAAAPAAPAKGEDA